ncbi:hypothetical protein H0G86_012659 [Trichoderma simmonsii]|uniref:Uncharacterized protein n=1 Tax=Trichoderma simmonsii TaxID=1491479 RepID=A0A8G0LPJ3_9HYPO|nr:hypothetical protein H0G86_012659 [Trichoderma simmonsii]
MTGPPGNSRNTQQMNEAAMEELAKIKDLLANVRDQLAQIANRMAASEARAEERMEMQMLRQQLMNLSVQQSTPSVQQSSPFVQQSIPPLLQMNLDLQQRMQQPIPPLQRMNHSLEQWTLNLQRQRDMAETQQRRRVALNANQSRRAQNTMAWYSGRPGGPFTPGRLAPFVSLVTGREIEGFPATFDDIAQINENDARRILADLEVATDGLSTAEMRDKIRSQVYYGHGL